MWTIFLSVLKNFPRHIGAATTIPTSQVFFGIKSLARQLLLPIWHPFRSISGIRLLSRQLLLPTWDPFQLLHTLPAVNSDPAVRTCLILSRPKSHQMDRSVGQLAVMQPCHKWVRQHGAQEERPGLAADGLAFFLVTKLVHTNTARSYGGGWGRGERAWPFLSLCAGYI